MGDIIKIGKNNNFPQEVMEILMAKFGDQLIFVEDSEQEEVLSEKEMQFLLSSLGIMVISPSPHYDYVEDIKRCSDYVPDYIAFPFKNKKRINKTNCPRKKFNPKRRTNF